MMQTPQNIVDFTAERNKRQSSHQHDANYQLLINRMSKIELLEEMVRFQEERSQKGQLTPLMMIRGKILFQALELNSETDELRILAGSYRRHLEHEIKHAKSSV